MAALLKELATVRCKDHEVRCWCSGRNWLHRGTQLSGLGAGTMAAAGAVLKLELDATQTCTQLLYMPHTRRALHAM